MRTFSEMDKHYDRHNKGICMDCGCTVSPWEYRCRSCRNKVSEDVAKEKEQKPECGTQIDLSIFNATQINEILNVALDIAAEYYVDALWDQPKRTDLICPLFDEEINECVDNYSCSDENVGFSNYECWRKQFIKDAISYINKQNKEN